MIDIQTENTPFFELSITAFGRKSITIFLYKEISTTSIDLKTKYEITSHSSGKSSEGIENDDGKAFAAAIFTAGYDRKQRVLAEIQKYHHIEGRFHKIGKIEFNKIVRKAVSL